MLILRNGNDIVVKNLQKYWTNSFLNDNNNNIKQKHCSKRNYFRLCYNQ